MNTEPKEANAWITAVTLSKNQSSLLHPQNSEVSHAFRFLEMMFSR